MEVGWASNDMVLGHCDWEFRETYDPYDDQELIYRGRKASITYRGKGGKLDGNPVPMLVDGIRWQIKS